MPWYHVTQEDINSGVAYSPELCPAALALKRNYPSLSNDVEVLGEEIVVGPLKHRNSKALMKFIRRFDRGKNVKPFSFYLPN